MHPRHAAGRHDGIEWASSQALSTTPHWHSRCNPFGKFIRSAMCADEFVRGYEFGSFNLSECTRAGVQNCPELNRLIGSRIAVMNFEVRAQLLGNDSFGVFDVPAVPTAVVFFIDAGAAWNRSERVDWTFDRTTTRRVPVVSAGIAFRSVIFGRLPIELYYAHPYQRPSKGNVTAFRIGTGF